MKRILILVLLVLSACTWVVQNNRTPEQRSADQTRVAQAAPPLGHIRVSLFPTKSPSGATEEPTGVVIEPGPTPVPCDDIAGNINAQ